MLIVSNEANNRAANTVAVLPITSNVSKVYPFEILLSLKDSGLPEASKAQAQQISTIAKERIRGAALGRLSAAVMRTAEDAMRLRHCAALDPTYKGGHKIGHSPMVREGLKGEKSSILWSHPSESNRRPADYE